MSSTAVASRPRGFRHDAQIYHGADDFRDAVSAFLTDAVSAGEPVVVVASAEKLAQLAPTAAHELVTLADMAAFGSNPARIIPTWRAFVDAHPMRRGMRGIGEPITPDRVSRDALRDYQHVESLLNLAFADVNGLWLRCLYDADALPSEIVAEAARSHPVVVGRDGEVDSDAYHGVDGVPLVLDEPLPDPPTARAEHVLYPGRLAQLRAFVRQEATRAGLASSRVEEFVLAVNEVASNSLMYAGGGADVLLWCTSATVVCEVRDSGLITDPLFGRVLPDDDEHAERGMWMVNQLCDLVQVRSSPSGSIIRLHICR